jgi:exopolysaccharide production protein ExoQ
MTAAADVFGRFQGRIPDIDRLMGGILVAALAVEPILGAPGALLFLMSGMMLLVLRPAEAVLDLADFRLVLILPAFCIASVIWSEVPAQSLRASIQLTATVVFAIVLARRLPPGRFLLVITIVQTAVVLLSVTTGNYRTDTGALTGYFASKNAMGAAAALLTVVAAGMALRSGASPIARAGALFAACLGVAALVLAQSIGALFAAFIGLSAYPLLWALRRLNLHLQIAMTALAVMAAGTLCILIIANIDAVAAMVLAATGKDITLTGRTDLWRTALDEIAQRPLLGAGFQAFWQPGNPVAERLWAEFGIASRTGFHFHNLYLSNAVELGVMGVSIQVALLVATGLGALRVALAAADYRASILFACAAMILSMTPLEVPIYFQFNFATLLMIATLVYARDGLFARGASGMGARR